MSVWRNGWALAASIGMLAACGAKAAVGEPSNDRGAPSSSAAKRHDGADWATPGHGPHVMTRDTVRGRCGGDAQPGSRAVAPIADLALAEGDPSWWSWRTTRWFDIGVTSGVVGGTWCRPGVVWTAVVAVGFALICAIAVWEQSSAPPSARVAVAMLIGTAGAIVGCGLATGEWRRVACAGVGAVMAAGPWLTSSVLLHTALIADGDIMLVATGGLLFGLLGIDVAGLLLGSIAVVWLLRGWWSTIRGQHPIRFAPIVVNAMLLTLGGVAVIDAGDLAVSLSR